MACPDGEHICTSDATPWAFCSYQQACVEAPQPAAGSLGYSSSATAEGGTSFASGFGAGLAGLELAVNGPPVLRVRQARVPYQACVGVQTEVRRFRDWDPTLIGSGCCFCTALFHTSIRTGMDGALMASRWA